MLEGAVLMDGLLCSQRRLLRTSPSSSKCSFEEYCQEVTTVELYELVDL